MAHIQGRAALLGGIAALAIMVTAPALAGPPPRNYDLGEQDLGAAVRAVALASGEPVLVPAELVAGKVAPGIHGRFTPIEAINLLLKGSDLEAIVSGDTIVIRRRANAGSDPTSPKEESGVVVTGTRIQQGAVASPIVTLTQRDIRQAGQNDLGDAIRSLPQDFGGGQNPGVAPGISTSNQNITGGSSANLRGLGADATLTLLNGHRLAYGSFIQAVDISGIPLAAVDRVDVVADGASAIYGSDAVGGVVNIILKPDFDGLATSARVGAATDGGDEEQQYNATGGHKWGSGGVIVAYDFQRGTAISSGQRSYTLGMPVGNTLLPAHEQHSALLSGHQDLGPSVTFGLDLTYNHRTQSTRNAITATSGYLNTPTDVSLAVAPSVKIRMGSDWTASVIGLYGYDHTRYNQLSYSASTATRAAGCYCDRARSAEASAEGPLFHLGGGDARLAFGGGYRWNGFLQRSATSAAAPIQGSQDSYFGFGELFLPLVSPDQAITAVHRLSLDAAVRYERYPGMAQVATPKLGLVYAPTGDFELKGSWGKSFKAPTLLQLYQGVSANLYPASAIGGARFPAGSTALLEGGGNSNLKPERADTWSVSLVAHPQSLPGARLEVSYFHIDYHNRIVQPFAGSAIFNALSDPMYSDYVTYDPTPAQQAAAISAVGQGLTNNSGAPYNPAKVVALVDDVYLNAVQQRIQGVDVAADYRFSIGTSGSVQLRAMGSWLDSRQTISSTAPSLDLSGTIFNPPHVRGRFVASWSDHGVTLTSVVNYVGGLTDPLLTPSAHVGSQTTLDLTAIVDLGASTGLFRNMSLTLTVRNALNQHPPYAAPSGGLAYYVPFDSTNYSAIGRFVGLTVSKTW